MKNKILTIAALFAVMVAMTGMASASDLHLHNSSSAPVFSTGFTRFDITNLASNPSAGIFSYTLLAPGGVNTNIPISNCCNPDIEANDSEIEVLVDSAGNTPALQILYSLHIVNNLENTAYNVSVDEVHGPQPIFVTFRDYNTPPGKFIDGNNNPNPVLSPGINLPPSPPPISTAVWNNPVNSESVNNVVNVTIPENALPGIYSFTIRVRGRTSHDDTAVATRFINLTRIGTKLTKTATPASGPVPLNVQYTVTETNIGDIPLTPPILTDVPPSNFTLVGSSDGDTKKLNPGATWTFTQNETYTNCTIINDTVTATTHPIINGSIRDDITLTENASATVTPTGCGGVPGKFKAWGLLGPKADPEKIFKVWVFSEFMPKGEVSVQDKVKNLDIQATSITSVVTNITAGKGTATGTAHVTSTGGTPPPGVPGNYNFTVNVVDAAHSGTPHGTFDITLTGTGGLSGYHNSGNMSFGVVSIIK